MIGTLLRTESCSIPTRLKDLPAAAQPRNVKANRMRATTSTTLAALPNPRLSWMAPRKARKGRDDVGEGPWAEMTRSDTWKRSDGCDSRKVEFPSVPSPKRNEKRNTASTR